MGVVEETEAKWAAAGVTETDVGQQTVQDRPLDLRSHAEAIETGTRAVAGAEVVPLKGVRDALTQTAVVLVAGNPPL